MGPRYSRASSTHVRPEDLFSDAGEPGPALLDARVALLEAAWVGDVTSIQCLLKEAGQGGLENDIHVSGS